MCDAPALKDALAALGDWYPAHHRVLPWRQTADPYAIWVSEIMLQQTRVEAVKGYWTRFLSALPTVQALAETNEDALLKLWEGLGYYSRVRNMQKAARQIQEIYDGQLPCQAEALKKLPGIGPYTAGAVASIAFGQPVSAVDGNVLRILSRLLGDNRPIDDPKVKKEYEQALDKAIEALADRYHPGVLNQGMMELGATVCLPAGAPLCHNCPWADICFAKNGAWQQLPQKLPKRPKKICPMTVMVVICNNHLLVRKRPGTGLLAGLWELPHLDGYCTDLEILQQLPPFLGDLCGQALTPLPPATHVFTHLTWQMQGRLIRLDAQNLPLPPNGWAWADAKALRTVYPLPSAFGVYRQIALAQIDQPAQPV